MNTEALKIKNETKYEDGSYAALVTYYGIEYAVHFIACEVRVYATCVDKLSPTWKRNKGPKDVKKIMFDRINSFGEAFINAHKKLYEVAQ